MIFEYQFPQWTFITGALVIANRILTQLSLAGLLFSLILFLKPSKNVKLVLGSLFVLFFGLLTLGELFPIDTTTEPVDISTIQIDSQGKKTIARQYINAKTNSKITDTVLVKDIFIFRKLYVN